MSFTMELQSTNEYTYYEELNFYVITYTLVHVNAFSIF